MKRFNPFVTKGYEGPDYFCDRERETAYLCNLLISGNNVTLISPRRMGKTGLLLHTFEQKEIKDGYYTFLVDIYNTKNLSAFVNELGYAILERLKPKGKKFINKFVACLKSIRAGITFDMQGNPNWGIELGDITSPENTLSEIFHYLSTADKPCIVAIDEFQSVANYPETETETTLRTYIQHCNNAVFIFSGSQRHMMGQMFNSPSRPFYQSTVTMAIDSIPLEKYSDFIENHFKKANREIEKEVITKIYNSFDGITWYIQQVCNIMFFVTRENATCTTAMADEAINVLLDSMETYFQNMLFMMSERQIQIIASLAKEGKVKSITSADFIKKHSLLSASSVQAGIKTLLDKDMITVDCGEYTINDRLFAIWLKRKFER